MRVWLRRIWITCGLSFTCWIIWNMQAHGVADQLRQSSATVTVIDEGDYIRMQPVRPAQAPAIVFLPGGGVDSAAYIPLLRAWADRGHSATLVRLPWRVAFTESSKAEAMRRVAGASAVFHGSPWVLAGHSRGAALAADFAGTLRDRPSALLLIATTHPRDVDRSTLAMPVLKILGSLDCVAPVDDARANAALLPASTTWEVIEGGNHAQFAHYGRQLGDCAATISREDQQRRLLRAVDEWLLSLTSTSVR